MTIEIDKAKSVSDEAAERAARVANSPDLWNRLWDQEGQEEWRKNALNQVYTRITRIIGQGCKVVDLGGGTGYLAKRLTTTKQADVLVVDHSVSALEKATAEGLETAIADLESDADLDRVLDRQVDVVVSTECIEHLSAETRHKVFKQAAKKGRALFSVPNDRLGPDEEPQHTVKYNAMSFKRDLKQHFADVRVEVLGPYLLAVCGYPKNFTLSMCLPCRDEAEDLEKVLASFRGVADEIVVGIDPRTTDNTWEVAEKYADIVFALVDPEGPEGDKVPNGGVHFSWIRNQCMDKCTSEWIFMTEGHERLVSGWDALLALDQLDPRAEIGFVLRTGSGQQWAFPWLCRNKTKFRYKRQTHNELDYPAGTYVVQLPQVKTLHERVKDREQARHAQRKVQNRHTLMDDWLSNKNANSLHYLGAEWREHNPDKAIEKLEQYLQLPKKNGPQRYHTRLLLAKLYGQRADRLRAISPESAKEDTKRAKEILLEATADDWQRIEHWIWLGDIACFEEKYEEALQWYLYSAVNVGAPPFTLWWVDLPMYSWIPCQRLASVYGELGRLQDSLYWARKVIELLPDDAEASAFEEAQANIILLEETINGQVSRRSGT